LLFTVSEVFRDPQASEKVSLEDNEALRLSEAFRHGYQNARLRKSLWHVYNIYT